MYIGEDVKKLEPAYIPLSKMEQSLWKAVWQVLKKLHTELPYASGIPSLGIYPLKLKTRTLQNLVEEWSLQHYSE